MALAKLPTQAKASGDDLPLRGAICEQLKVMQIDQVNYDPPKTTYQANESRNILLPASVR